MERVGLCPGTFDPVTKGHMDIIRRAVKLVDRLVIGVLTNPSKDPLFTLEERIAIVTRETKALSEESGTVIEVRAFRGLMVDFAQSVGAQIVIRGLRAVSDFEYEFQMVGMNARLNPQIETVFLMAEARYQSIASRLVKEVAFLGGEIREFVSDGVRQDLLAKVEAHRVDK
ncbi:MAG: pantetheine-phosphate adenylyltransferase [Sphingomonadales bacterium]